MLGLWIQFGFASLPFAQTISSTRAQRAQQQRSDEHWAFMTGLPANQIRELRLAAGLPDDGAERIADLDVKTLNSRNQILLVGGPGCLVLHILQQDANAYKLNLSLSDVPDRGGKRAVGGGVKKIYRARASHVRMDGGETKGV